MEFNFSIRLTEILISFAILQQSIEHYFIHKTERILFITRFILSLSLMLGCVSTWSALALTVTSLLLLKRFNGPYNGGSDRMSLLILICLTLAHTLPSQYWKEVAFAYLAIQLSLSYVLSGAVKIINPDWRNGQSLRDVFLFSVYPAFKEFRSLSNWPTLLLVFSWYVMIFELLFPLALLSTTTLTIGLLITSSFHLANAILFGLNRFLWAWLAAYPSIIWFQGYLSTKLSFIN